MAIKSSSMQSKARNCIKKYINIILALILLLYPLRHAATGLDLKDAGYALGNYRYFDGLNKTWKLATYLANIAGVVFSHLPLGGTWIGMNVYTGLLIGMTAACVFLFLDRQYGGQRPTAKCLLFLAEFMALSLCWAPSVILYQYLGYLLMTAASIVLFVAITKDKKGCFVTAGVILGLCVAVRMPNITYMALILPLWYFCFLQRKSVQTQKKDETWFRILIKRTGFCIGGYLAGALVPIAFLSVRYGFHAYPEMISSLFGMTETATDYKPASMVTAMFGDYRRYSVWLVLFLAYMAVGVGFFALMRIKIRHAHKITTVFKIIYIAGLFVVLRLCYGRGMFDFDYTEYFCMYKWVTVYLLAVLMLCIWCLVTKRVYAEFKLWAVFLLVTILITPLGSNNGLYPIMNNLFLVAPVSALMASEAFACSKSCREGFVFRTVFGFMMVCVAFQSILFGLFFVFHDKLPTGEERVLLCLQGSRRADGIRTTAAQKEQLEALDSFLVANRLTTQRVILFGDIPALAYLFDMEPAIYTTWVDLDSNPLERLQQDLAELGDEKPIVILGMQSVDAISEESGMRYRKLMAIEDFMDERGYSEVYQTEAYTVYQ